MANEDKDRDQRPPHESGTGGAILIPTEADRAKAAHDAEKIEEREYKQEQASIQRRILWTQIFLVAFGIIGAGVGIWQAYISQESADTAQESVLLAQKSARESRLISEKQLVQEREQLELDQRAWIGPTGIDLVNDMHAPNPTHAQIVLINSGKTPALNAVFRCVLMASDAPLIDIRATAKSEFRKIKGGPLGYSTIIPNVPTPLTADTGSTNEQGIADVRSGKKILYLFVWATYDDIFKIQHHTKFCAMHQGVGGGFSKCPQRYDESN